jgi:hypothetical protein
MNEASMAGYKELLAVECFNPLFIGSMNEAEDRVDNGGGHSTCFNPLFIGSMNEARS